jgi:hypothetical protein
MELTANASLAHSSVCKTRQSGRYARRAAAAAIASVSLLLLLLLASTQVSAQVGTADVLGTVSDQTGAVIVNAKVTVTNLGTGAAETKNTDAKGEYLFTTLPNGNYSVSVEMQGFKKFTRNFALSTGERVRIEAAMVTGEVSENVVVNSSEAAMLQTDSSTVSSTVEPKAVQDLPMANRNFYTVLQLQPGVSAGAEFGATGGQGTANSGSTLFDRRPFSTIVANGQSSGANDNLVNGFDNNEVAWGNTSVRPTVDGIAELKMESTNAPAEFGRAAGAVINVVTKSGSNQFHGSVFEFFRNQNTDAQNYFNTEINAQGQQVSLPMAPYHQNNFGGSVGGPIKKDKTFFFFGIEDDRINEGQTFTVNVPDNYDYASIQAGAGDFSDLCQYNIGCADPVLPADSPLILPIIMKMYQLYPKENHGEAAGVGSYVSSPPTVSRFLDWELRIDDQISPNDKLFGRYADNPTSMVYPGYLPSVNGVSPVGNSFGEVGTGQTNTNNMQLDYVHTFSTNVLLDAKAGYTRYDTSSTGPNVGNGIAAAFGMPNAPGTGAIGDDLPQIGGPGFPWAGLGGPTQQPYYNVENAFQYAGSVTYIRGTHEFKFGGGAIRRQVYLDEAFNAAGMIISSTPGSLLEGLPDFFQRQTPVYHNNYRGLEFEGYAQDNWRLTERLTLNLGVRYDVFKPYSDARGYLSNFNLASLSDGKTLDAHNFFVGGTAGVKTDNGSVAPRLGFAYSLNQKTVVRAGFGLTYVPFGGGGTGSTSSINATSTNPPYYFNYTVNGPNLHDASIWQNAEPMDLNSWNSTNTVNALTAAPTLQKNQRIFQTNMAAQRELGANTITLASVGVYGRNQTTGIDANQSDPPGPNSALPASYVYTKAGAGGIQGWPGGSYDFGNPNGVLNYVTSITSTMFNGLSNYSSMQAIYSRQLAKGLMLNANWTWAHAQAVTASRSNDQPYYGNSGNDIRHRISATASYQLPFGKSLHGIAGAVAKGWELNDAFQWQTGNAFMVSAGASCTSLDPRCSAIADNTRLAYTYQPGVRVYYPSVAGKTFSHGRINYAAFIPPVPGTNGNEGINSNFGPHFRKDDLSLFKTFKITERFAAEFRAEAFNISNTPNFVQTNTSIASYTQGDVTSQNPSGLIASNAANFGVINDTAGFGTPRRFQFALKVTF